MTPVARRRESACLSNPQTQAVSGPTYGPGRQRWVGLSSSRFDDVVVVETLKSPCTQSGKLPARRVSSCRFLMPRNVAYEITQFWVRSQHANAPDGLNEDRPARRHSFMPAMMAVEFRSFRQIITTAVDRKCSSPGQQPVDGGHALYKSHRSNMFIAVLYDDLYVNTTRPQQQKRALGVEREGADFHRARGTASITPPFCRARARAGVSSSEATVTGIEKAPASEQQQQRDARHYSSIDNELTAGLRIYTTLGHRRINRH